VLRFHPYWLNPSATEHLFLRNCHEQGASSTPYDARVWTNLAWLYLDEHRFDFNRISAPDPPLERAAEAARRAVSLQPDSARAHLAVAIVQWFRKDIRSFDRHAELALSLNPNDSSVNAELGLRYGLRGDWELSLPLIDRAISRDPIRWQTYRVSYAQHALELGEFGRALEELRLTKMSDHPALKVTRAAIYGHLGHFDQAWTQWNAAVREMPQLGSDPLAWIDARNPSPNLRSRLLEGLEKAGLIAVE
jgi:adenylate cyclase